MTDRKLIRDRAVFIVTIREVVRYDELIPELSVEFLDANMNEILTAVSEAVQEKLIYRIEYRVLSHQGARFFYMSPSSRIV